MDDSAIKAEINKLNYRQQKPAPFLRSFSLNTSDDWAKPEVDFNRQLSSKDGASGLSEPIPSIPAFGYLSGAASVPADDSMESKATEKHVAFGDEDGKEEKGKRKRDSF